MFLMDADRYVYVGGGQNEKKKTTTLDCSCILEVMNDFMKKNIF